MSGSAAAPGAWPARADGTTTRAVAASSAVTKSLRIMSGLLVHMHHVRGHGSGRRGWLVWRRCGRWQRLTDGEAHRRDLLLLGDDDLLRQAAELLVVPVAQQRLGHVDGALMVRHHH